MGAKLNQLKLSQRTRYIESLKKDARFFPNFWYKVTDDLKHGESPVILIVGKPRKGKTLTAIFWSIIFKLNFTKIPLERSIWKSIDKFMEDVWKEDIVGRSLIIDEAQKDLDISAWNNKLGMALVKYNGSQAIRGNILFIILPYARWLPWVQIPAINYIINVKGNGWSTYSAHKTREDDFKGKSYKVLLEVRRIPMVPDEILDQKETWEVPIKKEILREIIDSVAKKKKRNFEELKRLKEERLERLQGIKENLMKGENQGSP